MPNVKKKVSWDSNIMARSLSLLKNDRPITLRTSTHEKLDVKSKLKYIERPNKNNENVDMDINQNYRFQVESSSEKGFESMSSTDHRETIDDNNQQDTYTSCVMMCKRTDCEMVLSSTARHLSQDSNYYTSMDHCDESSKRNSCSHLLPSSFSTTSVPNTVASFSSSSLTSAASEEKSLRKGRLKVSTSSNRLRKGYRLARKRSLLSFMSRQFLVYRRNCHSVVGDAVLTFMLFLAMLHLSCCIRQLRPSGQINYREEEKKILDSILGRDVYDNRIRPSGKNGTDAATIIIVNLYIRSFAKIDDVKMEYSVQITFRQKWNDDRLSYANRLAIGDMSKRIKYLTMTDAKKVWMPDTFFRNEKEGRFHNILVPNVYIRIFPNGDVLYSIRVSLTLACPMNLKLYPLDRQKCSLRVASYGWTTDDLQYLWKRKDPVQIVENLHLPRFTLEKYISDYCNIKTNTGEYSCLTVDLTFKREFSYYLLTIYVPCCMLVIVSWVSFWLDPNAVPARVSLGVTTLLTMSTQTASINNSLPPVAYTKAIDVWTGVCVTFVFSALLEYALVNYASRSDAQRLARRKHQKQYDIDRCAFDPENMEDAVAAAAANNGGGSFAMKPLMRRSPNDNSQIPRNGPNGPGQHTHGGGAHNMIMNKLHQCEIHMKATGRKRKNPLQTWLNKFPSRAKKIDVISRVVFPAIFAVFNMSYWCYYLLQEAQSEGTMKA